MNACFANILLSGPCNLRCPGCIGRRFPRLPHNLHRFPLRRFDDFVRQVSATAVQQVSLTATNTDPLLYHHHRELVRSLRQQVAEVQLSLHTNGLLALQRQDLVELYDRATISFCSFSPRTSLRMTGSDRVLDLEAILRTIRIPMKLSVLVTDDNVGELDEMVARISEIGWRRLVLRRPFGQSGRWDLRRHRLLATRRPCRTFGGNPVFQIGNLEVTLWDFERTTLGCINLFSDGTISGDYLLGSSSSSPSGEALHAA